MIHWLVAVLILAVALAATGCSRTDAPGAGQQAERKDSAASRPPAEVPASPLESRPGQVVLPDCAELSDSAAGRVRSLGEASREMGREILPRGPKGTPERPGIRSAWVGLGESWDDGRSGASLGDKMIGGSGGVVVDTDSFVVTFNLDPVPAHDWYRRNVRIEGGGTGDAGTDLDQEHRRLGIIQLRFPRGDAGEGFTFRLTNVTAWDGGEEVALRLCRAQAPRAALDVRDGTGWRAFEAGDVVPDGPVTLRLRFNKPMDRQSVEERIQAPPYWTDNPPLPPKVEWADDQTVLLRYADPPPVIEVRLTGAHDRHGLFVGGTLPAVHVGSAPYLAVLDPAGGGERRLAGLMPEIVAARPSPDGRQLLFTAWRRVLGNQDPTQHTWMMELTEGRKDGLDGRGWRWLADGRLLRLQTYRDRWDIADPDGRVVAGAALPEFRSAAALPAGDRIALLRRREGSEEGGGFRVPHDLLILDVKTGKQTLFPDFVRVYSPPTEWIAVADLAWSPDGRRLAALSDGPDGATALVMADLESDRVEVVAAEIAGLRHGTTHSFSWSPDGRYLAAGPFILDAATARPERRFEVDESIGFDPTLPALWSPDGTWLLYNAEPWGEVLVMDVDTGGTRSLGRGLAAGWTPDGRALVIRWAGATERYVPEYP